MKARSRWQGTLNIVRFNWPFYASALVVLIGSVASLVLVTSPIVKAVGGIGVAGAAFFLFGSLMVSHVVYDRSDLYRWNWLDRALRGGNVRQALFCHCGFDEASAALCERLSAVQWQVLDHFDCTRMTEGSIHRARAMFPPTPGTLPSRYDQWPLPAGSADAVLGLLAIHELRSEVERRAWFAEAKRCLRKDGRVILVEHMRDAANFIAFGPGFLHFHSPESWRRSWEGAGLRTIDHFFVTPFVRVCVLGSP